MNVEVKTTCPTCGKKTMRTGSDDLMIYRQCMDPKCGTACIKTVRLFSCEIKSITMIDGRVLSVNS